MKKLNDEQLSRVLSAHDNDALEPFGVSSTQIEEGRLWGCLVQVALCDVSYPFVGDDDWRNERVWFDNIGALPSTTDEFLAQLEKAGLA